MTKKSWRRVNGVGNGCGIQKGGEGGPREKVTCEQRLAGGAGVHSIWERRGGARSGGVPRISEAHGAGARSAADRVRHGARIPKTL